MSPRGMTAVLPQRRVPSSGRSPGRSYRLPVARSAARLAEDVSRRTGRGAGGVIGGRVIMALAPGAAEILGRGRRISLVSGTNGKTTTTAMLSACLRTLGPVGTNADGANTRAGFVRALGVSDEPRLALEVDEGWLPWAVGQVRPETVALLNLSRDQLHRHHEIARLARSWQSGLLGADHVVANADDPAVVMAALAARGQTWVSAGGQWRQDSTACPGCGRELARDGLDWSCRCGLRRPCPDWFLEGRDLVGAGERITLDLSLPGAVNRANAAMAVANAAHHGVPPRQAVGALRNISSVAGRYEVFTVGQHRARLLLAKNPASWLEALDVAAEARTPVLLCFNSEGVDGRDPSWLYDVPFGLLAGRSIAVTGRRATDLLVRLGMAGLTGVMRADDVPTALDLLPSGDMHVVANYTAFQDARRALTSAA